MDKDSNLCTLFCFLQQTFSVSLCMAMVFFMNIYAIIKELVQISQQVTSIYYHNSSQILKITEKLNQSYPFALNFTVNHRWYI